ncbi:MAG: endo-1,4-beta-xylanase, partial [Candidatus Limnocylindrales bacterium]
MAPDDPLSCLLTRRQLLRRTGTLAAALVLGEACGATTSPSPRRSPGRTPSASSPPLPSPTAQTALTAEALASAVLDLPLSGTLALPGDSSVPVTDLQTAAQAFLAAGNPNVLAYRNPVAALGLALACADWSGKIGRVDLAPTLPKLPLTPVRLVLPHLPGGQTADVLAAATPPGLVLRPGTALLLAGVLPDGRVVLGVSDPARQVSGHPRLELALLAPATLAPLLSLAGAALEPSGALTLASGTHVRLAAVDPGLATTLVAGAGALFVDQVPLQPRGAKPALTADPIVPVPDAALTVATVQRAADGRLLGVNPSGTPVARARYRPWVPDWQWTVASDEVEGYTIRELADALGLTVGSFAHRNVLTDPTFIAAYEKIANTLLIGNALDMADPNWAFGPWTRDDWAGVLARWSDVSAAFAARRVPDGFSFVWSGAEQELAFAAVAGVRYVQAGMLLWGSNGVLPAIYNGGFSADELRKILEFMVKVRVLRYAGRVQEWIAVSEAAADLLWGNAEQRFWYDQLGVEIIDQVFVWAREADPTARLAFCEDGVLDRDTDATRATGDKFMEFLRHFKAAGIPVDKAVLENNLWIYAPPSKDSMVTTLQAITELGYPIGAAETTVSISAQDPIWAGRPRSVASV